MQKELKLDLEKRRLLAEKLRQLISGAISNQVYDKMELDGELESDDRAIHTIWFESWFLYDDFKEHLIEVNPRSVG